MQFIQDKDAKKLRERLEKDLVGPVTIDLFTQPETKLIIPGRECELCKETGELLGEVAALSDKITLKVHDFHTDETAVAEFGIEQIPAFVLTGDSKGTVRYLGIPSGYEFASLLEDLIDVSSGSTSLTDETRVALADLAEDVHIQVFVTPTCPFCPAAARMAHQMAVESGRITADVVEVSEFPELGTRYRVQGVPKIVMNESVELVGAQREPQFLEAVLSAAA